MECDFSDQAAAVLKLTTHESGRLCDFVVGLDHLLLALIQCTPDGILQSAGLNRARVIERIEQRFAQSRSETEHVLTPGCQTPRIKRVIISAQQRATAGNRAVDLQDLWHCLLQEGECVEVLSETGLDVAGFAARLT